MTNKTRRIAYRGIFIALIMGVGYALAIMPNVELVTALIFMAGIFTGHRDGLIIGTLGEFLFSALNPFGSGLLFLPMLAAQVFAMALTGFIGGFFSKMIKTEKPLNAVQMLLIGGTGFLLTLFYDILVSAAWPLFAGFSFREIIGAVIAGIGFSMIHIVANTLIFLLVIPVTARTLIKAVPYLNTKTAIEEEN